MRTFSVEPDKKDGFWLVDRAPSGSTSKRFYKNRSEADASFDAIMALPRCKECGDPCTTDFMEPYKTEIQKRQLCFTCLNWTNQLEQLTSPKVAIIDGSWYTIGETEAEIARRCGWRLHNGRLGQQRHVLGHGGAEFTIQFKDGRKVTTTNLWAGGDIPDHFRARMPDNAEFAQKEVTAAYIGPGSAAY